MYEQFCRRNENLLKEEKYRALDKAADIMAGTKEVIRTGFVAFDHSDGGFGRGELVLLGARPTIGKTSMALQIAEYNAIRLRVPVFYISLQRPPCYVMKRLLQQMTGIDSHHELIGEEANELFQATYTKIREAPFYVRFYDNLTMNQIRNEMRICPEMPQLVIVDEIGMPYLSKKESLRIMKEMRKLAEATDATVLLLSNISRLVDERQDHLPLWVDFPVPGRVADMMILMYREGYYNPEHSEDGYDPAHLRIYDCNGVGQERLTINYVVDSGRFEREQYHLKGIK